VQPPEVTLVQPNGGEVLYSGEEYEIVWRLGDKTAGDAVSLHSQDRYTCSSGSASQKLIEHGTEVPNPKSNNTASGVNPNHPLSHFAKEGISEGILRQELYYTIDFPEGGGKAEPFWRFIDTVPVGETSYVWQVPNTASTRCRVAIKVYYDNNKFQIPNTKFQTIFNDQFHPHPRNKFGAGPLPSRARETGDVISASREGSEKEIGDRGNYFVAIDISDGNFTIPITTDFDKSTAYNNGHKILTSPTGDKVHFVYTNEGWTVPSGIFYCYSQDSGRIFEIPEMVSSTGFYPALGLDPYGNPCASWVAGSNIYYTYWTASWAPPDTWQLPVVNVSPPSMVVDKKDTVHLVFVQYYWLPSDIGDLIYLKFKRTDFANALAETLMTGIFSRTPSIGIDQGRNLHLLWQGENCVCYWHMDSTGVWSSNIDTIYTTTTNERLYPVIDIYGRKVIAAWQDKNSLGNLEIYFRRKTDTDWEPIKKVAETTGESRFAVLAGGNYCLWQDNSSGNFDIYLSEYIDTLGIWSDTINLSYSLKRSAFPHCAYALVNPSAAKLYCLWTEGDSIPYIIEFKKVDVPPQPIIFADLGQEVQSIYCEQRDGYWVFGDLPYQTTDWGYEILRYKFIGLDPEQDYRLDLAYYFENNPKAEEIGEMIVASDFSRTKEIIHLKPALMKIREGRYKADNRIKPDRLEGIGRIIQALVVDGMPLDTAFVTPNSLVRRSVWLTEESYCDGEIIIEIEKIKGKRVVCSEMALYEFPGEGEVNTPSGPMGTETQITRPFFMEKLYPNPTKGVLRIKFNSPDSRKITIKLYDATGRLVHEESLLKSRIGTNEVVMKPEELSAGVYFLRLESEGYSKVEKAVLIR